MASAAAAAALLLQLQLLLLFSLSATAQTGFISLDCGGGADDYTDGIGIQWTSDTKFVYGGQTAKLLVQNQLQKQYSTLRYFPADDRKYCYTMNVRTRTRYLVRASFLYGNFDNSNVYPKFDISLGATPWSTVIIDDAATPVVEEAIILAAAPTLSVCLSNASTGQPFISSLELRQFNGSLYYTTDEAQFFLALSARINFGAVSNESVRYPDDPFDRIWESDSLRRANYLVDVAPGTEKISTTNPIFVSTNEEPPEKVMQTAVVGQNGSLNYRLDLEGFPANAWAVSYFAEIEDLAPDETRKFKLVIPGMPAFSKPTVDVEENAQGKYRLYQPGYTNVSLPFVFSFGAKKTNDSSKGPILNAMEIYKYVQITMGSQDANIMASLVSRNPQAGWAQEGGDPCLPVSWSWVQCSSEATPRVSSVILSGNNITGSIPLELTKLSGLVELKLDGNSFSGEIPDFSGCRNLQYIHLENNQLTGALPSSVGDLPNLKELYIQNNRLSGQIPRAISKKNIIFNFSGNSLHNADGTISHNAIVIIVCAVVGTVAATAVMIAIAAFYFNSRYKAVKMELKLSEALRRLPGTPREFKYATVRKATNNFDAARKLGQGGFGAVYKGTLQSGTKDARSRVDVAVKKFTRDEDCSYDDFLAEVDVIHRLRHRNIVPLIGWCYEKGELLLIYEYMPNGSLDQHLFRGSSQQEEPTILGWNTRYDIIMDVAAGLHYVHHEHEHMVLHRDIKASNIMLDSSFRGRLGDFGLARIITSLNKNSYTDVGVAGTWGFIAPEYSVSYKATRKTDIYALGVLILEIVTGERALGGYHESFQLLTDWVWRVHREGRLLEAVDDEVVSTGEFDADDAGRLLLLGLACCNPNPSDRPSMAEVVQIVAKSAPPPDIPLIKPTFMWPPEGGIPLEFNDTALMTNWDDTSSSSDNLQAI